jgi:hypothetical protein
MVIKTKWYIPNPEVYRFSFRPKSLVTYIDHCLPHPVVRRSMREARIIHGTLILELSQSSQSQDNRYLHHAIPAVYPFSCLLPKDLMYAEVQMPRPAEGFGSLNLDCVFFKHQLSLKVSLKLG